ncbi:hypothetical protein GWI33_013373 [Rhynchophorus ferrugineus]|uniref:Uncharacterized protein n=1 Tax=Rhynchophorus ferrugineus TaxID=354439 RepID=A0A834I4Q9_RHYFE|nr:hypothetical protein GWI33_013373 [Rhynchophorus ferrugineus]
MVKAVRVAAKNTSAGQQSLFAALTVLEVVNNKANDNIQKKNIDTHETMDSTFEAYAVETGASKILDYYLKIYQILDEPMDREGMSLMKEANYFLSTNLPLTIS